MSQSIINNWRDVEDDKDMFKIIKEAKKKLYKMYDEAVEEEKRWATYLFSQRKYDWFIRKTVTPICRIHGEPKNEGNRPNSCLRPKNKSITVGRPLAKQ